MVSDAHLQGQRDPVQHAFISWLEGLEADRLFLLGDIFHHWWTFRGQPMEQYTPVLEALEGVRGRGTELVYVPGNHDFGVGEFFRGHLGAEVGPAHTREVEGQRMLLAHGDEADASRGYRLLSRALRSGVFDQLVQALGPDRGTVLLRRLAGQVHVGPTNEGPLVAAQRAWATARLGSGEHQAHAAVMGHTHVLGRWDGPNGTVFHLGSWLDHRSWLEVVDDGPRLVCGEDPQRPQPIPEGRP